MEACSAALWACPLKAHGVLIYPLQLLAGVSLAPPHRNASHNLATGHGWHGVCLCAPCIRHTSTWALASSSGVLHLTKACPTWGKKRRLPVTHLRSPPTKSRNLWLEPSGKPNERPSPRTLEMVKVARQTYHQTHRAMFEQEGSYDLTSVFREMAQETSLLDVEIYKVQETWTGWQGLRAANCTTKASQRDIQFFCMVTLTKLPNIMGLNGIHSPEALHWWQWLLLLPLVWKGKTEWRHSHKPPDNHALSPGPGMYPVHGLFATSADTMRWHACICKSMAVEDREEGESEIDDDSDEDDGFLLEEF